ncbi:MAG: hypothetical protein JOZ91_06235 [Candidatus Eremiobacteraeota bacterium]|nr:hypothetical protein [Candidatus Eremiobacteraeota bacterium]MBV8204161.1 hypothetical protein [Candidatus Eremiobacteraeota bacterium]MBV8262475.1 hypothetical protein [Candidatus Eremiobacteraeota bacterium]MBV8461636.1 hypothetical protein [Candidatus Eremiobacteraeota bacterium]MBV8596459.1 hypothetical protein [Candidatus Eremiobacteraeota bacterium]
MDLSSPPAGLSNPFSFTAGLFGYSKSGDGAIIVSNVENGLVGLTFNPSLKNGGTIGVFGGDFSTDGGLFNEGVVGVSSGIGVEADGFAPLQPVSAPQLPALEVRCGGAPAIVAANGFSDPTNDIMDLDCNGNLTVAGSIISHGVPLAVTREVNGTKVVAYSPRQPEPTMEDVGEARLMGGEGFVTIDPAFAATIDRRANYLVFLTPEGDSRGLFVAQKTPSGFLVRENQGGRTSLAFEYRIVAKPYDTGAARLPTLTSVEKAQRAELSARPHVRVSYLRPWLSRRGIPAHN